MGHQQSAELQGQVQGPAGNLPCSRSCRPCGEWGGKDYNTVKVDGAALQNIGKENAAPRNNNGLIDSKDSKEVNGAAQFGGGGEIAAEKERLRQREEWEARQEEARKVEEQRREMERRIQEEQERQQAQQQQVQAERRRLQLEQEQREREAEMRRFQEEEARRYQEEERRRQEEAKEQARLSEEVRRQKLQEAENKKKADAWLKSNGFKGPNELVRKGMAKLRPLHLAVKKGDSTMVTLLLQVGADRRLTNGNKETALQLAQKTNKADSNILMITALSNT